MTQTMTEHEQGTTTAVHNAALGEHLERLAAFPDKLGTLLREQFPRL